MPNAEPLFGRPKKPDPKPEAKAADAPAEAPEAVPALPKVADVNDTDDFAQSRILVAKPAKRSPILHLKPVPPPTETVADTEPAPFDPAPAPEPEPAPKPRVVASSLDPVFDAAMEHVRAFRNAEARFPADMPSGGKGKPATYSWRITSRGGMSLNQSFNIPEQAWALDRAWVQLHGHGLAPPNWPSLQDVLQFSVTLHAATLRAMVQSAGGHIATYLDEQLREHLGGADAGVPFRSAVEAAFGGRVLRPTAAITEAGVKAMLQAVAQTVHPDPLSRKALNLRIANQTVSIPMRVEHREAMRVASPPALRQLNSSVPGVRDVVRVAAQEWWQATHAWFLKGYPRNHLGVLDQSVRECLEMYMDEADGGASPGAPRATP